MKKRKEMKTDSSNFQCDQKSECERKAMEGKNKLAALRVMFRMLDVLHSNFVPKNCIAFPEIHEYF